MSLAAPIPRRAGFYSAIVRPALFTRDSEEIHEQVLSFLGWASRHELICDALQAFFSSVEVPTVVSRLRFRNPVGLAAGFDKFAVGLPAWEALGFGFAEIGGVTWEAQPGNPAPRVFRVPSERALINRMGFNNPGAPAFAAQLAQWRQAGRWPGIPIGVNLGKSKVTPLTEAPADYARSFRTLRAHADFFVVNVSSPNTPQLRELQEKSALDEVLAAIQEINLSRSAEVEGKGPGGGRRGVSGAKPIWVKISPDLSLTAVDEVLSLIEARRLAGVVATNTTVARPETADPRVQRVLGETGGLSGGPLRARSTELVRHIYRQTRGRLPIIGVGGIFDEADAWEKITAGASLVQIYTGLVYEGPGIVRAIVAGLERRLTEMGLTRLEDAVGIG